MKQYAMYSRKGLVGQGSDLAQVIANAGRANDAPLREVLKVVRDLVAVIEEFRPHNEWCEPEMAAVRKVLDKYRRQEAR